MLPLLLVQKLILWALQLRRQVQLQKHLLTTATVVAMLSFPCCVLGSHLLPARLANRRCLGQFRRYPLEIPWSGSGQHLLRTLLQLSNPVRYANRSLKVHLRRCPNMRCSNRHSSDTSLLRTRTLLQEQTAIGLERSQKQQNGNTWIMTMMKQGRR